MAKREKFIVAVAAICVLVFLVYTFAPKGGGPKTAEEGGAIPAGDRLADASKAIDAAQQALAAAKPTVLDSYIVAHADVTFARDPFFYRSEAVELEPEVQKTGEERVGPSIELVYTGFLEIGRRRMAIVNDQEYELGDDVAGTGFLLRSVHPDWVEIESREGKYFLRVPFVEEGF